MPDQQEVRDLFSPSALGSAGRMHLEPKRASVRTKSFKLARQSAGSLHTIDPLAFIGHIRYRK